MCGSNNYFGLSFHPEVIARRARGARARGRRHDRVARGQRHLCRRTAGSSRRSPTCTACGTPGLHHRAIRPTSASSPASAAPDDTVLLDIESHASIYDGARLSGAQLFAFRHNSPADLARKLARHAGSPPLSRGHRRPVLDQRRRGTAVAEIADVCRASGRVADGRRGALVRRLRRARAGLRRRAGRRSIGSTSSSARSQRRWRASAASASRIIAALKLLHFAARPYVFTASGSPANIAGVEAALQVLRARALAARGSGRTSGGSAPGLRGAGFDDRRDGIADRPDRDRRPPSAPIAMWRALLEAGVYVNIVLPPACRAGCVPAAHQLFGGAHARTKSTARSTRSKQVGRALSHHRRRRMKLVLINPRNRVSLYGDYLWEPLSLRLRRRRDAAALGRRTHRRAVRGRARLLATSKPISSA